MEAESVVAAAGLAKHSISKLYGLVGPYRNKFSHLQDLYEDLGDLEKVRGILFMNHDGFLSRNTEDGQQLLGECLRLLEASKVICITLYDNLSVVLQPSASWGRVLDGEIQRRVSVVPNAGTQLHIWAMTLELLVKIMQLPDKIDISEARRVEKAINEARNVRPIIESKLRSAGAEMTSEINGALLQSVTMCDIVAKALKKKQILETAEATTIKNGSGLTPVPQTMAKSPWIRPPRS